MSHLERTNLRIKISRATNDITGYRNFDSDRRLRSWKRQNAGEPNDCPVRQDAQQYDKCYNRTFVAQQLHRVMNNGKSPTDGSACTMQDTGAQAYKMAGVTDGINEDLV
jgi:hypothetical protein